MESQAVSSADFVPSKDGTQSDELVSNGTTDTQYDEGVSCNNMRCSEKSEQVRKNNFTYMRHSNRLIIKRGHSSYYFTQLVQHLYFSLAIIMCQKLH